MATYARNQLHSVPLAGRQAGPTQPRKYLAPLALEELTASVYEHGIAQPIVCRQDPRTGSGMEQQYKNDSQPNNGTKLTSRWPPHGSLLAAYPDDA
jgi:hypothetical protein